MIATRSQTALDLGQVMGRQEDRLAGRLRLGHECEELALHQRIEARRRLVHDQQRGLAHEHGNDPDLLAVAPRQLPDPDRRVELEALGQLPPGIGRQSPQRGQVAELLGRGQLTEVARLARQEGEVAMHIGRPQPAVEPIDLGPAGRRPEEPEQAPDGGRLARAVRTEEAEDLALIDRQVDLLDPASRAVALGQVHRLDHALHVLTIGPCTRPAQCRTARPDGPMSSGPASRVRRPMSLGVASPHHHAPGPARGTNRPATPDLSGPHHTVAGRHDRARAARYQRVITTQRAEWEGLGSSVGNRSSPSGVPSEPI